MDLEAFEKQSKEILSGLEDMQKNIFKGLNQFAKREGSAPIVEKMKDLEVFIKSGNMAGIMNIQKEIIKMQQEDGGTDNGNK